MTDKQAWFLLALGVLNGGIKVEGTGRNTIGENKDAR